MTDKGTRLSELFDVVPIELVSYFDRIADGSFSNHEELELNFLPLEDAINSTHEFRDFHPLVQTLQGMILDDADTSNHHVYLSLGCCAGAISYLNHDGKSKIVFPTLDACVDAARQAVSNQLPFGSFHSVDGVVLSDQRRLSQLVRDIHEGKLECDTTDVILSLIPSLDLKDEDLLWRLSADDDFYVVEAIGDAIARRPRLELEEVALACQNHSHFQAAKAGTRALAAIAALK